MKKDILHRRDNGLAVQQTDIAFQQAVDSCNQLGELAATVVPRNTTKQQDEVFRWLQTCRRSIAMPRDVLRFEISLVTQPTVSRHESFQVRLTQQLPSELIFERFDEILIDGRRAVPTNGCLAQTLDLHFGRVAGGQTIRFGYFARVHFNAPPMTVSIGELNVKWLALPSVKVSQSELTYRTDDKHVAGDRNEVVPKISRVAGAAIQPMRAGV
ncbi:hypothetical protein [Neorhodopirellula lusitana]|uniref:hypothetical protein n=1 Tax=Neorhodopirellula lusitana TaxID=445327 RepID=UPI00384B912F